MHIKDYISQDGITFAPSVSSKKNALELLSESLSQQHSSLIKNKLLDALLAREKLGSTGLGKGIAIPHCRMEDLDRIYMAVLKLDEGIKYEAADDEPVIFLCCLVVPEDANEDHLQLVASLAELLDNEQTRLSINNCKTADCIHQILTQNPKHLAA